MVERASADRNEELLSLLAGADLLGTDELRDLRSIARDYVTARGGTATARTALQENRFDAPGWRKMCAEQGWAGMALPDRLGGGGATFEQLVAVLSECAAVLAYPQLLGSAVRAGLLLAEVLDAPEWLPAVIAGPVVVGVVGGWFPQDGEVRATAVRVSSNGWQVSVEDPFVVDVAEAGVLLVRARIEGTDADGLFAVTTTPARLADSMRPPRPSALDPSRAPGTVRLDRMAADLLELRMPVHVAWRHSLRATEATLAAEQVAASRQLLKVAVGYLETREQFERPLSSFQALRHRCADLLVEIEAADAAARLAGKAVDGGLADCELACSIAVATASDCFVHVAAEAIQLHGGIGFTWEHDAQLYFRRAQVNATLLGDARWHRARIAALLELNGAPEGRVGSSLDSAAPGPQT
jgi:alkylation response protein AidB-like acyl-CoA dehydrogenase